MGKNNLNKTRSQQNKEEEIEKENSRDERKNARNKRQKKNNERKKKGRDNSERNRQQQDLEKKASSDVESKNDSSEDEHDDYSSRKQFKKRKLDSSSDDDSEYDRNQFDRNQDNNDENENESDDNSRKRKHDEKTREHKSAKVSPNKIPFKMKRIMSKREVHDYCKDPENTSVREKLYAKKNFVQRAIDEFVTTKVFCYLKFAPTNALVGLLRSAENNSNTIPYRKGVEDDDFEDYFKGKVSTCFTKLRHATTQNTKRRYRGK